MTRLVGDIQSEMNTPFQEWLGTMESWKWALSFNDGAQYGEMTTNLAEAVNSMEVRYVFFEDVRKAMDVKHKRSRSYEVDLRNRRRNYGRFQSLRYANAHIITACARASINAEQYIDEVYTLKCT
ncbi:hypothetical protein GOBAR_DD21136 [Gossypium barbadense]|nr:hypothetical protein GOBAR_DD21136 [Gossypium barbadense]